jgi:hypothetical protein
MAKRIGDLPTAGKIKLEKRTSQGGKAKRSSMNKGKKRSFKSYRGQGK